MDDMKKVDRNALILGSLLLALLLVAVAVFVRRGRSKSGSTILLVGPSDGGKTAIFSSLAYNHAPPTHTSLQQNAAFFRSPSPFQRKPLQIVDIPGHPRIRGQFSEYFQSGGKTKATGGVRAVIFVCDAAALTRNSSTVAEHLHLIMHAISNFPPSKTPPPLLIFANKADLLPTPSTAASLAGTKPKSPNKSLAITRTTTILERELEKRRQSSMRSGAAVLGELGDDDSGGDGDAMGGLDITDGDAFSFEKWDGGEVTIRSGWVSVHKGDLSSPDGIDSASEDESKVKEKLSSELSKADGLADLVDWIATLRYDMQHLFANFLEVRKWGDSLDGQCIMVPKGHTLTEVIYDIRSQWSISMDAKVQLLVRGPPPHQPLVAILPALWDIIRTTESFSQFIFWKAGDTIILPQQPPHLLLEQPTAPALRPSEGQSNKEMEDKDLGSSETSSTQQDDPSPTIPGRKLRSAINRLGSIANSRDSSAAATDRKNRGAFQYKRPQNATETVKLLSQGLSCMETHRDFAVTVVVKEMEEIWDA
ncbi:hypothetical protein FRC17_006968, partial [Serendipita sp. 399]